MDFSKIKLKAQELKNKAVDAWKDALEYSTLKLAESKITLKNTLELEDFVNKSENTTGKDSKTGETKNYTKRVIIIFCDTKSDFFTQMLYIYPVLSTKAYSQNVSLKLADVRMKELDEKKYKIKGTETLVVFENLKVLKVIHGAENIQKLVKNLSLDINKAIEEL